MSSGVRQLPGYIIPRSEDIWCVRNGMQIYNHTPRDRSPEAIDDVNNGILLHCMFDQRVFCPVVKAGNVVSHYLKRTNELGNLYHNAEIRIRSSRISMESVCMVNSAACR